eukprot:7386710-Prymnesium_polylepis.2
MPLALKRAIASERKVKADGHRHRFARIGFRPGRAVLGLQDVDPVVLSARVEARHALAQRGRFRGSRLGELLHRGAALRKLRTQRSAERRHWRQTWHLDRRLEGGGRHHRQPRTLLLRVPVGAKRELCQVSRSSALWQRDHVGQHATRRGRREDATASFARLLQRRRHVGLQLQLEVEHHLWRFVDVCPDDEISI